MSVENLQGEIWKVIDHPSIGCYDNYAISNYGRVLSRAGNKEKFLKGTKDTYGYLRVHLSCDGKAKIFQVHRLVALMFIPNPNPEDKPCVNHKSEIKTENFAGNLEWVSVRENNVYGSKVERCMETRKNSDVWREYCERRSKKVYQYTTDGELVNIFQSTNEAERQTGFNCGNINKCCLGKLKTAYNFIWSYEPLTETKVS